MDRVVGRYLVCDAIASGGAATVHVGRMLGPVGFSPTVAIKVLHPSLATDPELARMFVDEARLSARIRHPNVVSTLDVVDLGGELLLVMEYVQGASIAQLLRTLRRQGEAVPQRIAGTVVYEMLLGLHAAHTSVDDEGDSLGVVHRDVSPQNVLVGTDGITRVVDFGVAMATGRLQTTQEGQIKGKIAYMSPEQLRGRSVDLRTDVYAAGVVLWEMLTGKRLFLADSPPAVMTLVLEKSIPPPSAETVPGTEPIGPEVDELVLRALSRDPERRFASAEEMSACIAEVLPRQSQRAVGAWVERVEAVPLAQRAALVARVTRTRTPSEGGRATGTSDRSDAVEVELATLLASDAAPPEVAPLQRSRRLGRPLLASMAVLALVAVGTFAYRAGAHGGAREPTAKVGGTDPGAASTDAVKVAASTGLTTPEPPVPPREDAPRASSTAQARSASPPRSARPAERDARCSPPYSVDANGYHIPKPQCM